MVEGKGRKEKRKEKKREKRKKFIDGELKLIRFVDSMN